MYFSQCSVQLCQIYTLFTSLDTTVGVSNLLFGGVDVGVTVVQVTELILSVELTSNRVWSCSWSCNRSSNRGSSWGSPVGHHCLSCVGEGVVGGVVVAVIATIAWVAMVAMIWMIVLLVRLVRLVARVDVGRLDLLSTGGRQKAGHDLQRNVPF